MEIFALDKNFNRVVTSINYTNLQWSRKYYSCGDFSVQVSAKDYAPEWQYIYTSERPEMGIIQKREYKESGGTTFIQLSGFFYENILNDKACFPRFKRRGNTETVMRELFTAYKDDIPVQLATANIPPLGDDTALDFSDDSLGKKMYATLATRELSYRVIYDYVANTSKLSIWAGKRRTQSQTEHPFYVFSTDFGNVDEVAVDFDASNYKNYCIIPAAAAQEDSTKETMTVIVDLSGGNYKKEMVLNKRSAKQATDQTLDDFVSGLKNDGLEALLKYQNIQNIELKSKQKKDYMEAYDLGDVVDMVISPLKIAMESRIIEAKEVFKPGEHSVTLVFGNKKMTNYEKARLDR